MKKRVEGALVLVGLICGVVAGCGHNPAETTPNKVVDEGGLTITPEQAQELANGLAEVASIRFTGLTDHAAEVLGATLCGEYGEMVKQQLSEGFEERIIYLDGALENIYRDRYEAYNDGRVDIGAGLEQMESESNGGEANGGAEEITQPPEAEAQGTETGQPESSETEGFANGATQGFLEYEDWLALNQYDGMDDRIEYDESGYPFIRSTKLNTMENGKAAVLLAGELVDIDVGTAGSLYRLVGDHGYDFETTEWQLFDNGQLLVYLQTKGYEPLGEDTDDIMSGSYQLTLKGDVVIAEATGAIQFRPNAECIPGLTKQFE